MLKKTAEKLFQNSFLCSAAPSGFVRTSRGWWSFCLSKKLVVVSRAFHLGHRPNVVPDEADGEKKKKKSVLLKLLRFSWSALLMKILKKNQIIQFQNVFPTNLTNMIS